MPLASIAIATVPPALLAAAGLASGAQPARALPLYEQARAILEAAGDRAGADLTRQGIALCYASMGQHAPAPTAGYGYGHGR